MYGVAMVGAGNIVHEKFTAPRRVPVQFISSFTIAELFAISKIIIIVDSLFPDEIYSPSGMRARYLSAPRLSVNFSTLSPRRGPAPRPAIDENSRPAWIGDPRRGLQQSAYYRPFRNSGAREEWIVRVRARCGPQEESALSIGAAMKNRVYDNKRGLGRRSRRDLP